jgi:hypothetical protein
MAADAAVDVAVRPPDPVGVPERREREGTVSLMSADILIDPADHLRITSLYLPCRVGTMLVVKPMPGYAATAGLGMRS